MLQGTTGLLFGEALQHRIGTDMSLSHLRRTPASLTLLLLAAACPHIRAQSAPAQTVASVPYIWRSVVIRGGGFVSGIVYSRQGLGAFLEKRRPNFTGS